MSEIEISTRNEGLHHQAKSEANAFAGLVARGAMTVTDALHALAIPPHDRLLFEEFAAQQGGLVERDIRRAIRLRDMAVAEFERLVSSGLFRHSRVA